MTCVFCNLPADTNTGNHNFMTDCIAALQTDRDMWKARFGGEEKLLNAAYRYINKKQNLNSRGVIAVAEASRMTEESV